MAISNIAMKAYTNALETAQKIDQHKSGSSKAFGKQESPNSFAETISDSLKNVNDMQQDKSQAIQAFASGENQNVHDLMITMQKASVTMKMTSAVRGKVMEAYKEMMHIRF